MAREPPPARKIGRRAAAECVGTGMLLAVVVGSGIMAERLSGENAAIALLANSLTTGAGLVALIIVFGPTSGAHLNPAVTLAGTLLGGVSWREASTYVFAQFTGAFAGVAAAHVMFDEPLFSISQHARSGTGQWWSEFVATFGLLAVVLSCVRTRPNAVPFAVGTYIAAAYWFTASTSFANPAVTFARTLTDSFTGLRPIDAPAFVIAQIAGTAVATLFMRWLLADLPPQAEDIIVPHLKREIAGS